MTEQTFRQQGDAIPPHPIPDWATHWCKSYSPNRYDDAIQFTDDPNSVETPVDAGKPDAALISRWYALIGV